MARSGLKRQRAGAKRLDLAPLREVLRDRRCWACLGVVTTPPGAASHYQILPGAGGGLDVLVEVVTQPDGLDLTCRLGATGGAGAGVWQIPREGDEVLVAIPAGAVDFMPAIVAVLASGEIPDGVAPGVIVVASDQVLIHDGSGGAEPLVTKSQYDAHTHSSGAGQTSPPDNAATSGTTVLKAK